MLWPPQVWCILKNDGESAAAAATGAASHQLTVCTYPEVRPSALSVLTFDTATEQKENPCSPCPPQIFVLSGVIAMVTCAVFLRLNSLLKLAVLLLAVAVYAYLTHLAFLGLTHADTLHRSVRPLLACSCFIDLWSKTLITNFLMNVQTRSCRDNQTHFCLKQKRYFLHT